MDNIESLKYPIGRYHVPSPISDDDFDGWIRTIEGLPSAIKDQVGGLSYEDLGLTYRPGGWTVKQVVHHLADSHMNSFIRFKLILTEDTPIIKPYNEAAWAKTPDADSEDITESVEILEGLHKRWTVLLKSLNPEDRKRMYFHPEYHKEFTLEWMLGLYDWHCRHHLAHIEQAIAMQGDFTKDREEK